jgi:hypothetical protein
MPLGGPQMSVLVLTQGSCTSFHKDVPPGPESLATQRQVSTPSRSRETVGQEYDGRAICLKLKEFTSPVILPFPTQNPDGPELHHAPGEAKTGLFLVRFYEFQRT